jgi:hypothetical protein
MPEFAMPWSLTGFGPWRVLVHAAFAKVVEQHPELTDEEAKFRPFAPSSSIPSLSIEQPVTAPAALNGCHRVDQRPRVFARPP